MITPKCKTCQNCYLRKGLSRKIYICLLKRLPDKTAEKKRFEKVDGEDCCAKWKLRKGIIEKGN